VSTGGPSARFFPTAVWTGTEMIVHGGEIIVGGIPQALGVGGRYAPSTDAWTPVTTSNAPVPRGAYGTVWTGTDMIVWGGATNVSGLTNTGSLYKPALDTWTSMSTGTGDPSPRYGVSAVWTGSEMIVWGGQNGTTSLNTG